MWILNKWVFIEDVKFGYLAGLYILTMYLGQCIVWSVNNAIVDRSARISGMRFDNDKDGFGFFFFSIIL